MVRYRPEAGERGYTFRLVNSAYSGSPTGTISDHSSTIDSSIYKERIDSLFRERQHRRNEDDEDEDDDDDDAIKSSQPTMEHLKLHFQKVMAEERKTSAISTPASTTSSKNNNTTTYITVNNQVNSSGKLQPSENKSGCSEDITDDAGRSQRFNEARNAVQAKISKMFEEAKSGGKAADPVTFNQGKAIINIRSPEAPTKPEPNHKSINKQQMPLPPIPVQTTNPDVKISLPADESTNRYKVDYLGSIALPGRATSLESLQFPLKDLYGKYCKAVSNKLDVFRGTVDISPEGLKIRYHDDSGRQSEILNPFATIAVWAAVKFVWRSELTARGLLDKKFAFLPLICDPENQDKQNLFHALHSHDSEWLTSAGSHPPIFTCVMRNMNKSPKTLDCHAFVCDNPEDAIVIAANLYQALLRNMKNASAATSNAPNNPATVSTQQTNSLPTGILNTATTTTSSTPNSKKDDVYVPSTSISNWSESSVASGVPVRPPRRKKKLSVPHDTAAPPGVDRRRSIRRTHSKSRSSQGKANLRRSMRGSSRRSRIKRSVSERQMGELLAEPSNVDILTKVPIPRSKSFMTVPQNYSIAELFEELQKHEGINSIDDVLKMIVNKDRMSFNDLSPAYKEMVMKLALTMTKDEIFQRSKNIMRNQTSKSSTKSRDSDAEHSSSSRISSVLRATKKSLSKWGSRSASTGYSIGQVKNDKVDTSLPVRNIKVKSSPTVPTIVKLAPPVGTRSTERKPTPAVEAPPARSVKVPPRLSQYVPTCSDCTYDTENCSHKCYCSRVKASGAPVYRIRLDSDTDTSHNSSVNAAQYHGNHSKPSKNRHNYARKTTSLTSWSALSGAESPLTAWRRNTSNLNSVKTATSMTSSASSRLTPANASFIRRKSLSSYLSDTSLDSDVMAMTEPVHRFTPNTKNSFAKQPEILRRKSRSSHLSSETELESMRTTSSGGSSFIRVPPPPPPLGYKSSPESIGSNGYQSYDSTGSSGGRNGRHFSLENLSSARDRRNSNSSSDNSSRANKKVLMVSAVDTRGKIVYRGTSASQKTPMSQKQHRSVQQREAGDVLSVKKSTEIAAMFSNLKLNQTTDIIIDQSTAEETDASELSTDDAYSSMKYRVDRGRNRNGFSKSMENSLGYLP